MRTAVLSRRISARGTRHLIHRLVGHCHELEAVVTDLRLGQCKFHLLGVGCAHVHAGVAHLRRIAPMGLEICSEIKRRLVISAFGGKQQPLGI